MSQADPNPAPLVRNVHRPAHPCAALPAHMSARKRKLAAVQPIFQQIQGEPDASQPPTKFVAQLTHRVFRPTDKLILIKPRLTDTKRSVSSQLIPDLDIVAALAQSIAQHRPKTNKDWQDVADTLDREGASLQALPSSDGLAICGSMQGSISGIQQALSRVAKQARIRMLSRRVGNITLSSPKSVTLTDRRPSAVGSLPSHRGRARTKSAI